MNRLFFLLLVIVIIYFIYIIVNRMNRAAYLKAGKEWEVIVKEISKRK